MKTLTKVYCLICKRCRNIIYSRAIHDYRQCSCGDIAIDGGFDYCKISFAKDMPIQTELNIPVTKQELYDDWNKRIDKYGLIKGDQLENTTKASRKSGKRNVKK